MTSLAEPHFPGFDVLGQAETWDAVTRTVVLARLVPPASLCFFGAAQEPAARALVDRLLAQDGEPRLPVLEMIDRRLSERQGDGYRHKEMPEDWEAWSRSIDGLELDAREETGRPFADLDSSEQKSLIEHVRTLEGDWHGLPAGRLFELWMRYVCDAFYSHPSAWNEIGFGGPAYPRGYKNLGIDRREPWEVAERFASDPVRTKSSVDQGSARA